MSAVDSFKQELDRRIAEWEELGVLVSGDRIPQKMAAMVGQPTKHRTTLDQDRVINKLIATRARELKRPFVSAFQTKRVTDDGTGPKLGMAWRVFIPNTRRCEVLRASFNLVAVQSDGSGISSDDLDKAPVIIPPPRTKWVLDEPVVVLPGQVVWAEDRPGKEIHIKPRNQPFFIGDVAHYDHWINKCRTDEAFRRALGTLPAEVMV